MQKIFLLASAAGDAIKNSAKSACGDKCGPDNVDTIFSNVTNALLFVIGAVAVIMIIIGGLRYITSNGDPKAAEAGRNTIMYSVIGIIVAMAAYAIVNFVAGRF